MVTIDAPVGGPRPIGVEHGKPGEQRSNPREVNQRRAVHGLGDRSDIERRVQQDADADGDEQRADQPGDQDGGRHATSFRGALPRCVITNVIAMARRCLAGLGARWQWKANSCPFAGMTRIRFKGFVAVAGPNPPAVSQLPPGSSPRNPFNVGGWGAKSTRGGDRRGGPRGRPSATRFGRPQGGAPTTAVEEIHRPGFSRARASAQTVDRSSSNTSAGSSGSVAQTPCANSSSSCPGAQPA